MKKCESCGTTKKLQEHHISYEPEEKIYLCLDCHSQLHDGHGVGRAKGVEGSLLEGNEEKFVKLWKDNKSYIELMEEFDISFMTVYNWRKKLKLNQRFKDSKLKEGRTTITVDEQVWRELISRKQLGKRTSFNEVLRQLLDLDGQ